MSAFQVIAKAASVALLAVTNKSWLLGYVVADHTLHLFYKVARNDAVMYAPMPPAASYVTAPLIRVLIKTVSDFTGSPLLRLPFHLGGSYWLFNLAMSQVSGFVCVHLYIEHAVGSVGGKVAGGLLWAGAGGLAAGWLTTWIYFVFRKAVPKYVRERRERNEFSKKVQSGKALAFARRVRLARRPRRGFREVSPLQSPRFPR
jgi:hypothetical protein